MSEATKDEGAPKEQEVNWYADMAMTVTFMLEIVALLRHCQVYPNLNLQLKPNAAITPTYLPTYLPTIPEWLTD